MSKSHKELKKKTTSSNFKYETRIGTERRINDIQSKSVLRVMNRQTESVKQLNPPSD